MYGGLPHRPGRAVVVQLGPPVVTEQERTLSGLAQLA
jgi:hypothetical protein